MSYGSFLAMTLSAYAIRADLLLHPLLDAAAFLQAKTCFSLRCQEAGSCSA